MEADRHQRTKAQKVRNARDREREKALAIIIGHNIRTAREEAGMSAHTLALEAGYRGGSSIANAERGLVTPSIYRLAEIALVLGKELSDLLDGC
jgi:ribosome-binding protein aMBF1 (putative translation factor)